MIYIVCNLIGERFSLHWPDSTNSEELLLKVWNYQTELLPNESRLEKTNTVSFAVGFAYAICWLYGRFASIYVGMNSCHQQACTSWVSCRTRNPLNVK